jgi:alkylhydroperoxidase family enzyme
MRLPDWTPERKPQPKELVDAILARRGGTLLNLDRALLWSEPLARGWNTYLKVVRTELPTSRKLRELGICTVALLTGANYEYHHHAPDFLGAGGTQAQLDALNAFVKSDPRGTPTDPALTEVDRLVIRYAAQMTLDVKVSDEVFDLLRRYFDETQIVELTSAIATYNMVARFLVALGITPEH